MIAIPALSLEYKKICNGIRRLIIFIWNHLKKDIIETCIYFNI